MLKATITIKGERVLGHFKKFVFNIPKSSNAISSIIANKIKNKARRNLAFAGAYSGHRHNALLNGTDVIKQASGKWVAYSYAEDEKGHDYAPDVEYGTKPHWIKNPDPRCWGWKVGNQHYYILPDTHYHPGAQSKHKVTYHYFSEAVEQTTQEVRPVAVKEIQKTLRESGFK